MYQNASQFEGGVADKAFEHGFADEAGAPEDYAVHGWGSLSAVVVARYWGVDGNMPDGGEESEPGLPVKAAECAGGA